MKKISIKNIILFAILLFMLYLLKKMYIHSIDRTNLVIFFKKLLVSSDTNNVFNVIWFLPFILILYFSTIDISNKVLYLELRFGNRKRFIHTILKSLFIRTLYITSVVIVFHFTLVPKDVYQNYDIGVLCLYFVYYIIFFVSINFSLIYIFLLTRKYIYSFIICLICIFIICNVYFLMFKLALLIFLLINIIVCLIGIKKRYMRINLGGDIE